MNMTGTSGCNPTGNVHGNGFSGNMRSRGAEHFPPAGHSLGHGNNACQTAVPEVPNSSVSGADVCCGNGQGAGSGAQHYSGSGMNSHLGGCQGCSSNGMSGGTRGGINGNNFNPNGSFHNNYMNSHGQVSHLDIIVSSTILSLNSNAGLI